MKPRTSGLYTDSFGKGPNLVMVHGWAMHSGVWRDFAQGLSEHFRVTLIDLPGYGLSATLPQYSLDSIVNTVAAHIPDRAHWMGWSLGTLVVSRFAELFPDRVYSLIFMAGSPKSVQETGWPGVQREALEQVMVNLERDFTATLKNFIHLQTHGQSHARRLARRIEIQLYECEVPEMNALRGGLSILCQSDQRPFLQRATNIPVLAVLGTHDKLVPKELEKPLTMLGPQIRVKIVHGAAHLPFATHYDETVALVSAFIYGKEV